LLFNPYIIQKFMSEGAIDNLSTYKNTYVYKDGSDHMVKASNQACAHKQKIYNGYYRKNI
jgi:hypothetical protein